LTQIKKIKRSSSLFLFILRVVNEIAKSIFHASTPLNRFFAHILIEEQFQKKSIEIQNGGLPA
jgi:hypothetical protein